MQGRTAVKFLLGFVVLAVSSTALAKLEVHTTEHPLGVVRYAVVSEEIMPGDVESLRNGLAEHSGDYFRNVVVVDSPGGSVDEAMKIGKLIRSLGFEVIVPRDAICFSSCVYILAAGVDKTVAGAVGIHRPYFGDGNSSRLAASLKEVESKSAQYFDAMNIPVSLTDLMFTTPPSEMRVLNSAELAQYRLNATDYVIAEERSLSAMDTLGWSRSQYEAFRTEINYRCSIYTSSPSKMMPCMREIAIRHNAPQALIDTFQ